MSAKARKKDADQREKSKLAMFENNTADTADTVGPVWRNQLGNFFCHWCPALSFFILSTRQSVSSGLPALYSQSVYGTNIYKD